MLPFTTVRVVGPSMEPSLLNGEWWLVRRGGRIRAGDVILLTHPGRPDLHLVKRVVRATPEGWWVEGDSPASSEDSRAFGAVPHALVEGRLIFRYRPLPPKRVPRHGG
ncbi:MAG: nickel-type superoxide dismutase maturation protease [Actinomycetota bacterium]